MSPEPGVVHDTSRYASLGLVANPFAVPQGSEREIAVSLEISAEANRLLSVLAKSASQDAAKPVTVIKSTDLPTQYALRAIGQVEQDLIKDQALNILHAYIQLYMMRRGRVRSTLSVVGERLTFRDFDETLALYVAKALEEPDESLASFQLLGSEALVEFASDFADDPAGVIGEYFGSPALERRPELGEVADLRLANLSDNVDETDDVPELDESVGFAPGTGIALPEEQQEVDEQQLVVDYLIEYTSTHLSKVIARGLRMYRERGLAALMTELNVTRAPRKTLTAVMNLASVRFDKVAIIYDGFENWPAIEPDLRQKIIAALAEMRWMLQEQAVFVFLLERDGVPELEEQFGSGPRLEWEFPGLITIQGAPNKVHPEVIERWLSGAAASDAEPMTLDNEVLKSIMDASNDDIAAFTTGAAAAIENAADRGVASLDSLAQDAGLAAIAAMGDTESQ